MRYIYFNYSLFSLKNSEHLLKLGSLNSSFEFSFPNAYDDDPTSILEQFQVSGSNYKLKSSKILTFIMILITSIKNCLFISYTCNTCTIGINNSHLSLLLFFTEG